MKRMEDAAYYITALMWRKDDPKSRNTKVVKKKSNKEEKGSAWYPVCVCVIGVYCGLVMNVTMLYLGGYPVHIAWMILDKTSRTEQYLYKRD